MTAVSNYMVGANQPPKYSINADMDGLVTLLRQAGLKQNRLLNLQTGMPVTMHLFSTCKHL